MRCFMNTKSAPGLATLHSCTLNIVQRPLQANTNNQTVFIPPKKCLGSIKYYQSLTIFPAVCQLVCLHSKYNHMAIQITILFLFCHNKYLGSVKYYQSLTVSPYVYQVNCLHSSVIMSFVDLQLKFRPVFLVHSCRSQEGKQQGSLAH